ncbi:MAG: hypothetical protein AAGA42_14550 [Actinomycetota bacterium]
MNKTWIWWLLDVVILGLVVLDIATRDEITVVSVLLWPLIVIVIVAGYYRRYQQRKAAAAS